MVNNPGPQLRYGTYYILSAAVAVAAVALRFVLPLRGTATSIASIAVDVALVVLIWFLTHKAKLEGRRPTLTGSLAGAIFGLVGALGSLIFPTSRAAMEAAIVATQPSISAAQLKAILDFYASGSGRLVTAIETIFLTWLLALLVAWISSFFGAQKGGADAV